MKYGLSLKLILNNKIKNHKKQNKNNTLNALMHIFHIKTPIFSFINRKYRYNNYISY